MTVESNWFWFYYALWLASVFTLVLVLRQSSENRSIAKSSAKSRPLQYFAVYICMVATGQEMVREKNSSRSGKSQGISLLVREK